MKQRTSRGAGAKTAAAAAGALLFALGAAGAARPARAQTVLYDGTQNTTLGGQGWSYQALPGSGGEAASEAAAGGVTTLTTSAANGVRAGYARVAPFALDRAAGFSLDFDLRLLSEAHASNDRAGFNLIVIGRDKKGIELGFWTDRVWAQSDDPLFTHAEEALLDTTAAGAGAAGTIRYRLSVQGDLFGLSVVGAGGAAAPLLSDRPLRDYTAFSGPIDPYETPDFLFLGDNTTSARGAVQIARVTVAPLAAVPEPGILGLLLAATGGAALSRVARRRRAPVASSGALPALPSGRTNG